jgi:hypothetical protein
MDAAKQQKAKALVAGGRITRGNGFYWVPSQNGDSRHKVVLGELLSVCTCEDYELTGRDCKHIVAARMWEDRQWQLDPAPLEMPPPVKRKSYPQNWPAYNQAQNAEGRHFPELLADLMSGVADLPPKGGAKGGRPAVPIRDAIFSVVYKVYCGFSARRFASDVADAHAWGFLSRPLCHNSVLKAMENPELYPVLSGLVRESAAPLAAVESNFAVDSSGFCTTRHTRWFDVKYGTLKAEAAWVKCHICTGVKTNCVTAVEIGGQRANDSPMLPPLVGQTARNFRIGEVSADKAYACRENFEAVAKHGGTLYAAYKSNATGAAGGLYEKMFHYFQYRREEYLAHYHRRSNVESTFSAIKRKFGDAVRSKTDAAQKNEVLCKLIAQNLTCLIGAIYELGIAPQFWRDDDGGPREVIRFPVRG